MRQLVWQRFGILILLIALAGCATLTVAKTAEDLAAVGEVFLSSAQQIDAAYRAGLISPTDYGKWRAFVPQFKLAFRQAEMAVQTARAAGETATPAQTAALVRKLKDQLLALLLELYAPAAKGVTP